jgi:trk system potassium uptake protein TrkH
MTTTGFSTCDFNSWIPGAKMLLLLLMFIGGCGGSTSGAIKVARILTLLKHSAIMMRRAVSPKAMFLLKYSGKPLSEEVVRDVISFTFFYLLIAAVVSIILSFLGINLETAISATVSCLGNVGPGLGGVGPASNYAWLPNAAKFLLAICMGLGRLELFTVLMLLFPYFWKR